MNTDDHLPNRRSRGRIQGFDYSSPEMYFITLCTRYRRKLFGRLKDTTVELSNNGRIAEQVLRDLSEFIPVADVHEYSILPDHLHVLIFINCAGQRTISSIVQSYKAAVTKQVGVRGIWQEGFYEHIVRNERDLNNIREYILSNAIRHYVEQEEYDAYKRILLSRSY